MKTYTDSPYKQIPHELLPEYTMNGQIPVRNWWLDSRDALAESNWTKEYVDTFKVRFTPENIRSNTHGREPYGGAANLLLSSFLDFDIKDKNVAVIGSATPWIECILMNLGNKTTTIEYNVPNVSCYDMKSLSYEEYSNSSETYDYIVTYSSIEHSGLGRYGDPLDPNADIKCMDVIHNSLSDDGLLFWGAPVGRDALNWNAHRVYGEIRLAEMFKRFNDIKWFGMSKDNLSNVGEFQPVIVLQKAN